MMVEAGSSGRPAGRIDWARVAPAAALAVFRLLLLAALPYEALFRYGDYEHFFNLAEFARNGPGGWPLIGHWVEFPPVFPYLSLGVHALAGGTPHLYSYILAIFMTICDAANVHLLMRIGSRLSTPSGGVRAAWIYAAFLALPAFGWWTFEPLAVLWMLLAYDAIVSGKVTRAGMAAGLGTLTKVFPGAVLLLAWRFWPRRRAVIATAAAALVVAAGLAPFLVLSPEMAAASLRSQASKGSWETVWALVDGNRGTGIFGPLTERLDPSLATVPRGQPARIPHWIPTLVAGVLGVIVFLRTDKQDLRKSAPLLALLFSLIFLWARGWSPQWLAYLAPLLLLALPVGLALGFGLNLVAVSLLEWPVLLSRGAFDLLWVPVVLRTLLLVLLALVLGGRIAGKAATPVLGGEP
jgi:hypothetical protein